MNKPEQRDLDLTPFVGSGFDCETFDENRHDWLVCELLGRLSINEFNLRADYFFENHMDSDKARPRLNKPQVLDDYSKVLVDGLVWNIRYSNYKYLQNENVTSQYSSHDCLGLSRNDNFIVEWIEFIGVERGSGLEDWAERHGVPIIDWEAE